MVLRSGGVLWKAVLGATNAVAAGSNAHKARESISVSMVDFRRERLTTRRSGDVEELPRPCSTAVGRYSEATRAELALLELGWHRFLASLINELGGQSCRCMQ